MVNKLQILIIFVSVSMHANLFAEESSEINQDPHYSEMGFFDIHICNWPERPDFFKVLFSSEKYRQIHSMNVYTPDNKLLVTLDKQKFRSIKRANKPDKRVYILDIDTPETASTGWYKIDIETNEGKKYQAKDFVLMTRLEKISKMQPSDENKAFNLPITLKWEAVSGSQFYQAFVRDVWTDELVFQSKLITTPEIKVPEGKLVPGGSYSWSVHARDTNEHVLLGDFHMGSKSKKAFFNVAE